MCSSDLYNLTALHTASTAGQEAAVKTLLERGADIEATDEVSQGGELL